jgi:hypothetical protein
MAGSRYANSYPLAVPNKKSRHLLNHCLISSRMVHKGGSETTEQFAFIQVNPKDGESSSDSLLQLSTCCANRFT